jgi:hypothetical protein
MTRGFRTSWNKVVPTAEQRELKKDDADRLKGR